MAIAPHRGSASGIDFSEGLVAVRVEGKVGFMDASGTIVIKPKYDDVYAFSNGLAPVELGHRWGYIDRAETLVIPIKFDIAHMFSEGLASVFLREKWGYINTAGHYVIPPMFDAAQPFCGGVAAVQTSSKVGKDKFCRSPIYHGKHGLINHHGHYVWRDVEPQTWHSGNCG